MSFVTGLRQRNQNYVLQFCYLPSLHFDNSIFPKQRVHHQISPTVACYIRGPEHRYYLPNTRIRTKNSIEIPMRPIHWTNDMRLQNLTIENRKISHFFRM